MRLGVTESKSAPFPNPLPGRAGEGELKVDNFEAYPGQSYLSPPVLPREIGGLYYAPGAQLS